MREANRRQIIIIYLKKPPLRQAAFECSFKRAGLVAKHGACSSKAGRIHFQRNWWAAWQH